MQITRADPWFLEEVGGYGWSTNLIDLYRARGTGGARGPPKNGLTIRTGEGGVKDRTPTFSA